eukprot:gene12603-6603_t
MPKLGKKLVKNMVAPRAPRALLGSGLNDDSGRAVSREYRGKKKVAAALLRDSSLDDMLESIRNGNADEGYQKIFNMFDVDTDSKLAINEYLGKGYQLPPSADWERFIHKLPMFIEKYGEPGGPVHMGDLVRMATSEMVKDDILQPGQRNKKKKIADVKKDEKIVSEIQKTLMSFGVDPTCIDTEAIKSMPNIQAYGHLLKQASLDMLARGETPTLDKLKS